MLERLVDFVRLAGIVENYEIGNVGENMEGGRAGGRKGYGCRSLRTRGPPPPLISYKAYFEKVYKQKSPASSTLDRIEISPETVRKRHV